MKLQFNLLPNVKQQYLKAKHTKRTVIAGSIAAMALALFILLFMIITVDVINKKKLSDADKNISNYSQQLKNIPNINKILTIQNQLQSVATLHQSKHITSRLYQYLPQVTPSNVCLGQITLDTTANSLLLQGTTDSLKSINVFIDTLKFTTYTQGGQGTGKKAFPTVSETSFSLSPSSANGTLCAGKPAPASYQLTIAYDPALFSNSQSVSLNVPSGESTTRSVLDDPSNPLFNGQTKSSTNSTTGGQ
jgi:Tfp pilus assembly protein PilN